MKGCLLWLLSLVGESLDLHWMIDQWQAGRGLAFWGIPVLLGCVVCFFVGCSKIEQAANKVIGGRQKRE